MFVMLTLANCITYVDIVIVIAVVASLAVWKVTTCSDVTPVVFANWHVANPTLECIRRFSLQ